MALFKKRKKEEVFRKVEPKVVPVKKEPVILDDPYDDPNVLGGKERVEGEPTTQELVRADALRKAEEELRSAQEAMAQVAPVQVAPTPVVQAPVVQQEPVPVQPIVSPPVQQEEEPEPAPTPIIPPTQSPRFVEVPIVVTDEDLKKLTFDTHRMVSEIFRTMKEED